MNPIPTTWTDGYGRVHAGPPPKGYWIASDDRWYAPELHPDSVPTAADPAADDDLGPVADPDHDVPMGGDAADSTPYVGAFDLVPGEEIGQMSDPLEQSGAAASFEDAAPFQDAVPFEESAAFGDAGSAEPVLDADPVDDGSVGTQPQPWQMPSLDGVMSHPSPDTPTTLPDTPPPLHDTPPSLDDTPPSLDDDGSAPNKRTLLTAIVGVLAVLGLAAAGFLMTQQGDDTSSVISGEDAADSSRTSSLTSETPAPIDGATTTSAIANDDAPAADTSAADTPAADTPAPSDVGANPGAVQPAASNDGSLEGIESCSRIDSETLEISMVNVTDATASYLLTVVYLDETGARVGDDNVYVSSLRPGERTVERSYVFSDAGIGCDVIAADRYDRNGVEGLADISSCTIREPNSYGFIEADLTATNSGPSDVDYTVEVALVDTDDVRRGYGTAYIDRAPVGATASGEVYTTVEYDETLRCDVVAVTRFESTQ